MQTDLHSYQMALELYKKSMQINPNANLKNQQSEPLYKLKRTVRPHPECPPTVCPTARLPGFLLDFP